MFYFGEALHVLKSSSQWLVENKLSLHPGKIKCILFGTRKKLLNVHDFCEIL